MSDRRYQNLPRVLGEDGEILVPWEFVMDQVDEAMQESKR